MAEESQTGLRILQVVRPATGGIRRHVSLLCRELPERGLTVDAAMPAGHTLQVVQPFTPQIAPIGSRHHLVRDVKAGIRVAHLARRMDMLHGHGLRGAWISYLASRRSAKPFILTAHNLAPVLTGQLAPRLVRATVRAAAARIAVSNAVVESFTSLGFSARDWIVISNGVDLSEFNIPGQGSVLRSLEIPEGARVVAAVGRLSAEKGLDLLIEAAPQILQKIPNTWFVVAGDGPERSRLEELAAGLEGRVIFTGPYEAVYGLMTAADVVVIPSRQEGQGIVALEAMAAGRAVVAASVGGLTETVVDGETGILIPPESAKDLSRAVVTLLSDPEMRGRMGSAGRDRVEERYTVDRMIDATIEVYRKVANARQGYGTMHRSQPDDSPAGGLPSR